MALLYRESLPYFISRGWAKIAEINELKDANAPTASLRFYFPIIYVYHRADFFLLRGLPTFV
jgi:hypothetical protein